MKFDSFSRTVALNIVRCIENAVGDDILEDIRRSNLRTTNSVPFRIWDFLNRNLLNALDTEECSAAKAFRGPWQMVVLLEKSTGFLITIMRESRFAELRRDQQKRDCMHYVDMFPRMFNTDLSAEEEQLAYLPKEFADESLLERMVQQLLQDLTSDISVVRNHVLVLFDTQGFQLTRVRAVMITPNLDIAEGCEEDWTKYISSNESVVVEKVEDPTSTFNNPHRGLKLSEKALERKQRSLQYRQVEEETKKENN